MADHLDIEMRTAAFTRLEELTALHSPLPSSVISEGFQFRGERIPFINSRRGIFKPRAMPFLLSIRTVFPKPGGKVWYDDQRDVHQAIYSEREMVEYAFMGTDPAAAENRWLKAAWEHQTPIIYFLGVAPGLYEACFPSFIAEWSGGELKAKVIFGTDDARERPTSAPPDSAAERKYGLRLVKHRLHQATIPASCNIGV